METNQDKIKEEDIQEWLESYLAKTLNLDLDEIDIMKPFDGYGLDSSTAITMTGDLEKWLGIEIDPTLAYDYPTIKSLAKELASQN